MLDRLPADARPHASFDCRKAGSPSEKTICGSLELAAFDRSVSSAYAIARDEVKDDAGTTTKLVSGQKAWIHQRDTCGTDAACLLKSMKKRIAALAAFGNG